MSASYPNGLFEANSPWKKNLLYFSQIVRSWSKRVLPVLLLQHKILSPETPKWFYFSIFVASSTKNESIGRCFTKMCPTRLYLLERLLTMPKICCGDFLISHETYKIQACRRVRKLKCFQTKMACKIKLIIGLCRFP